MIFSFCFHQVLAEVQIPTMYVEEGDHLTIPCPPALSADFEPFSVHWFKETEEGQLELFENKVSICTCIIKPVIHNS